MKQPSSDNRSRLAVLAVFFTNGALLATWVSRIPAIQEKLSLSEGQLGLVLLGLSVGVLTALAAAGGLSARFGSPKVTIAGALGLCITLPLLAMSPNPILLWIVLFAFGGALSLMDVAMNEQAVLVERAAKKPLMSSFHGAFSIGGLVGALMGAGMASEPGQSTLLHFLIAAVLFGGLTLIAYPNLMPVSHENAEKGPVFRLPERALWGLGVVAFCSAISEGAMTDWSAVYLVQILKTDAGFAALGFAAFSLTMTLGRLTGDWLAKKITPVKIVQFGGLLATLGLATVVSTQTAGIALAGFAAIGLGLANIVPLSFSAAGNYPGIPAAAGIAGVATIGYAGFLAGPPLIGLVAEATSLRIGLGVVLVLAILLIFTGRAVAIVNRGAQNTE